MEYQKILDLLYNTSNQLSKFNTKNWIETNDGSCWTYNKDSQIKYKTSMLKFMWLYWCIYTCEWKYNNWRISIVFRNCALFTDCISEIKDT